MLLDIDIKISEIKKFTRCTQEIWADRRISESENLSVEFGLPWWLNM